MPKVIYASENPYAGLINGVTTAVFNMRHSLGLKEGKDYIYVCPSKPGAKCPSYVWDLPSYGLSSRFVPNWIATVDEGYRVAIPPSFPFYGNFVTNNLIKKIKKMGDCHPHLQGTHFACEQLARACIALNIPYGLTLHTYDEQYLNDRVHIKFIRNLMKKNQAKRSKFVADNATWVTCPSKWYEERFRTFTRFSGKIEILPSIVWPFDILKEKEVEKKEIEFRKTLPDYIGMRPLIGCFGRKTPEKNLEFALKVMAELKNNPSLQKEMPAIVFIGPGSFQYEERLKIMAKKLNIEKDCVFIPGMPNNELVKLAQVMGILVFPSLTETQGLVRVEAQLAQAIPIVVEKTGMAENLNEPELCLPLEPKKWANLIMRLLEDEDYVKILSKKQREKALQANNPHSYAVKLHRLYARLDEKKVSKKYSAF